MTVKHLAVHLTSPEGPELELTILGYEFPGIDKDYDTSNWLIIRVRTRAPSGPWESVGPFMSTFDVEELATWLDAVAAEAPMINRETLMESGRAPREGLPASRLYDPCEFLEPNLRFVLAERTRDHAVLHVYFGLDARPPWARVTGAENEESRLVLTVSSADLKAASQSLRSQLCTFPVRATAR